MLQLGLARRELCDLGRNFSLLPLLVDSHPLLLQLEISLTATLAKAWESMRAGLLLLLMELRDRLTRALEANHLVLLSALYQLIKYSIVAANPVILKHHLGAIILARATVVEAVLRGGA